MFHKSKKSLGQNFLKSQMVVKKIIEAGEITPDDIILEIGPGKGILTEKLLEKSKTVIAVEKDNQLFDFLKEKFSEQILNKKLILINEDILKFDYLGALPLNDSLETFPKGLTLKKSQRSDLGERSNFDCKLGYKIIANIPYNITGAIFQKFLTAENQPTSIVLMVQHEIAKRILDKKESLLSLSVKAYGEPKIIMKVPARFFSPAPKVNSAIISIKNISRNFFKDPEVRPLELLQGLTSGLTFEKKFWQIVRAGFAHKRKKLSGNLREKFLLKGLTLKKSQKSDLLIKIPQLTLPEIFQKEKIPLNSRAENLNIDQWKKLVKYF
ncbi:MAG: 16S rRNA (adenine(1518)-N(6)/adenine(1519)-N(6))-dimethyltransferase RsmA [Patescibacteria group bacterium]